MKQGFGKISRIAVPERDNHTCVSGDPGNSAGDHFWDGDENVTLKLRTVTGPRNNNINQMVTNWMIWITQMIVAKLRSLERPRDEKLTTFSGLSLNPSELPV